MDSFEGKVAVVTGAGSGIGFALAAALGAEGAKLVLADIEKDALDVAVLELLSRGFPTTGYRCDVSDPAHVEALADAAEADFGAVHFVANNAGVAAGGLCWEIDLPTWEWVLGVDLWGVIHGVRTFVPRIIEAGGGHVLNTASMAGLTSNPFMGPYNVAKHGVVTLSETLYQDLQLSHPEVGVTVLCPGWVRTKIASSSRNRPGAEGTAGEDAEASPQEEMIRTVVDGLVAGGIDPHDVARQALDAVRAGQLHVLTHPEWSEAITGRTERIVAGEPPAPPVLGAG